MGEMAVKVYADTYIHTYARTLKTFLRFLEKERYITKSVEVPMPKIGDKRIRVYTADEVKQILAGCQDRRDQAFIYFMIDSSSLLGYQKD